MSFPLNSFTCKRFRYTFLSVFWLNLLVALSWWMRHEWTKSQILWLHLHSSQNGNIQRPILPKYKWSLSIPMVALSTSLHSHWQKCNDVLSCEILDFQIIICTCVIRLWKCWKVVSWLWDARHYMFHQACISEEMSI